MPGTCVCNVTTVETAVFTDTALLPRASVVLARLFIGAAPPQSFGRGYVRCTSSVCRAAKLRSGVVVHMRNSSAAPVTAGVLTLTAETIFEVPSAVAGQRSLFLKNKESTVHVDRAANSVSGVGASFSFRNPPHYNPLLGEQYPSTVWGQSSVHHLDPVELETEELLDHLFTHPNTAPFVAHKLIQRFVTSNPSPRYLKAVADAFRSGSYPAAGRAFSGKYGDLGATLSAVLLDREARSTVLLADPSAGRLHEPILKVMHVMRVLEYSPNSDNTADTLLYEVFNKLGQEAYNPPSVFGFYLPEYSPAGVIGDVGLVSPEAQLGTAPCMVGFLNGISSLIELGLTTCDGGFADGGWADRFGLRNCRWNRPASLKRQDSDGVLKYTPSLNIDGNVSAIVQNVDLLLTGGQMSAQNRRVLEDSYRRMLSSSDAATALRRTLKLLVFSSEFHSSNLNTGTGVTRPIPQPQVDLGRSYKAIVVVFLEGGADTDNLLVPHSQCATSDLYADYVAIRKEAALPKASLLQVSSPPGEQPCNKFGVHQKFPLLKQLYDAGDAAFFAGIGAMVEPLTKHEYIAKTKVVPPSLFGHNIMQRSMQNVYAQNPSSGGVMGRIVKALTTGPQPYKSELYSLMGNAKMLEGAGRSPNIVDKARGVTRFNEYSSLKGDLSNLTSLESQSLFAETYSSVLEASLRQTERLGGLLDSTTLSTTFPPYSHQERLSASMEKISKIIKLRSTLQTERDVFIASMGGFDSHSQLDSQTGLHFGSVNTALTLLTTELKAQGLWDNVTILTVSDFGRTLTPNGQGTDHGWAGNHVVLGGAVRGGHILGNFPQSFSETGDLNLGRGRMLPTSPWESLWKPLAQWMGVPDGELTTVLPNLKNFPKAYSKVDLFKSN